MAFTYMYMWGGLAFFCQKTWRVAYTRVAAFTSEYGNALMCMVGIVDL